MFASSSSSACLLIYFSILFLLIVTYKEPLCINTYTYPVVLHFLWFLILHTVSILYAFLDYMLKKLFVLYLFRHSFIHRSFIVSLVYWMTIMTCWWWSLLLCFSFLLFLSGNWILSVLFFHLFFTTYDYCKCVWCICLMSEFELFVQFYMHKLLKMHFQTNGFFEMWKYVWCSLSVAFVYAVFKDFVDIVVINDW